MAKKNINKAKRPPTKWEKIFTNDMSDKGLTSKIYNKHLQLNIEKKKRKKKKQATQLKTDRRPKQTSFQKETDSQQAQGKMLSINDHQGNANQKHSELSPHISQNGCC